MALPSIGQASQTDDMGYVKASIGESIKTSIKAAGFEMANIFQKSPILRMFGGKAIAETANLKKRELFERTGRDEQGRKLTKREFEEREKRRKDLGALAEMRDILEYWKDNGVPVMLAKDSDALFLFEKIDANILRLLSAFGGKTTGSPSATISPVEETKQEMDIADLAMKEEEVAEEKEREDDEDTIESEQRQQKFFTKMFDGLKQATTKLGEKFGGIGSIVSAAISGLGSVMSKLFATYLGGSLISSLLGGGGGGKLLSVAGKGLGMVGRGLAKVGGAALGGIKAVGGAALGGVKAVGGALANSPAAQTLGKAGSQIGKAAAPVVDAAKNIGGKAVEVGKGLGGKVADIGKGLGGKAADIGKGLAGDVAEKGGGFFSKVGSFFSKTGKSALGAVSKLNPFNAIKNAVKTGGKTILKGIFSIPGIGATITTFMKAMDIKAIKEDPSLSPEQKKEKIGVGLSDMLGSVLGTVGGGVIGSFLFPGLGTIIGSIGGEMLGSLIGESIGESIGGKGIYDFFTENNPLGIGSLISIGDEEQPAAPDAAAQTAETTGTTPASAAVGPTTAEGTTPTAMASAIAPVPAESLVPPMPAGAEISSMSAENTMLKSMPPSQTSIATTNNTVQQSNNAVVASAPTARAFTGIDNTVFNGSHRFALAF